MGKGSRDETDFRALNKVADAVPVEPEAELTKEELFRLAAIRSQLRLN